ncbi:TIR domain-containing adapter molecule 1 [Echinops telfairi]|uniref:TIR domain-containing adapter molecule 1 n=1 Tax=Echinops telfairi TaxID=9371 RepID=A0ABM0ZTA0_ECHTE|nr:TIR domain-containing adapter molecule 1 [Echinops telfairi]
MACPEPSLPGAFLRLSAAGQDKLLHLKHKLKALQPSCRGAGLLRAMVLLALGQDTEARLSLEALRSDPVARLVAHRWAGSDGPEAPEEPLEEAWAVARLYHLLAEEKLCPVSLPEAAYRVALQAFSTDARLPELQAEAQQRCGWDVADLGGFRPLCSDRVGLLLPSAPPSGTRSLPRPIRDSWNWSLAGPLRSTGSPASLASNLEISQSPTMALLTQPTSTPGPSKLSHQPAASLGGESVPMGRQEPEQVSWPPSVQTDPPQELPDSPAPQVPVADPGPGLPHPSAPPEPRAHCPVECSEVSEAPPSPPTPAQSLSPPTPEPPGDPSQDGTLLSGPGGDTASQKTRLKSPPPPAPQTPSPSPSSSLPSATPESTSSSLLPPGVASPEEEEEKFYGFVVLHARADEAVALRVRQKLEALGVPDGATFCEDFQVPGCSELSCLQDAIDRCAFTVLLLTQNFDCRLSLHQVTQALMSSFGRQGWQDSVVPFQPLETPRLTSDVSRLLSGLVPLDEHSQLFDRKVKGTFKKQRLQARRARWEKERQARAFRERRQHLEAERQQAADVHAAYSALVQTQLAWQVQMEQLQAAFGGVSLHAQVPLGAQVPFGGQVPLGVPPTWPACPGPRPPQWPAGTRPAAFLPAPPSPGLQPLIIQHAQMVQLGLSNHMWGQGGVQAPEDKSQEAD